MSQVNLHTYNQGYYGYLDAQVRDTLGQVQDLANNAGSGSLVGIQDNATGVVLTLDDVNKLTAEKITVTDTLTATILDSQALSCTGGTVLLTGLHVYSDNADAVSGGIGTGSLYRTPSGDLKVVV